MSLKSKNRSAAEVQTQIHYRLLEQSAASERRYRILIEHLRDPVFQLDGARTLSFVNAAWCRMVGIEEPESMGRELMTFVDERDRDRLREAYAELDDPDTHGVVSVEFRLLRKNHSPVDVECSLQRSIESDVIGSLRDLTKHKILEDRLRAARDAAESASRLKSSFLANMSHEIRTPLSAVLGFTEILGEGGLDEADRREYAMRVQRNGDHLLGLVDDILDFSKIESGRLEICEESFELCEVVDDVVSLYASRVRAKGLELSTHWSGSTWPGGDFVSDPMRLRQILSNLLSNAVKFTSEGSISLEVRVSEAEQTISFVVSDTGVGIPADSLTSIFEPFRQAHQETTRRFGGTGLGLAISARLARLLRGHLVVESELGEGSRFRLDLPLEMRDREVTSAGRDAPVRSTAPAPAAGESSFDDLKVLVVEDTPDLRRLMVRFLSDFGLEADSASNGAEALEMLRRGGDAEDRYDMVLMDMQMPVLDGYGTTRALRAGGYDGLIVALTAYAMSGDRQKCLAAGCDDYVAKPVNRAALGDLFNRYLGVGKEE